MLLETVKYSILSVGTEYYLLSVGISEVSVVISCNFWGFFNIGSISNLKLHGFFIVTVLRLTTMWRCGFLVVGFILGFFFTFFEDIFLASRFQYSLWQMVPLGSLWRQTLSCLSCTLFHPFRVCDISPLIYGFSGAICCCFVRHMFVKSF